DAGVKYSPYVALLSVGPPEAVELCTVARTSNRSPISNGPAGLVEIVQVAVAGGWDTVIVLEQVVGGNHWTPSCSIIHEKLLAPGVVGATKLPVIVRVCPGAIAWLSSTLPVPHVVLSCGFCEP